MLLYLKLFRLIQKPPLNITKLTQAKSTWQGETEGDAEDEVVAESLIIRQLVARTLVAMVGGAQVSITTHL